MDYLPVDKITILSRQRSSMAPAELERLQTSIADKGLLHPIVLRQEEEGTYVLVAGGRRLEAMKQLHASAIPFTCNNAPVPLDEVPYTLFGSKDYMQQREAELEENILRENLSWQDQAAAIAELRELRKDQPKSAIAVELSTASKGAIAPSTARQVVDRSILVTPFLDDPEVAKAKSLHDAYGIVTRKLEREFLGDIRDRLTSTRQGFRLHLADCREQLRHTPDGVVDCILVDPPYGMEADTFGNAAQLSHTYEDSPEAALALCEAIFTQGYRIAKSEATLLMFCDIENFPILRRMGQEAGWKVQRTPLIWHKGGARGHTLDGSYGFRRSYELILYATKGGRKLTRLHSDVLAVPVDLDRVHAAQKPVELYRLLLSLVCDAGNQVWDPCCGRGTIFPAAKELRLKAVGVECDPDSHALALETLEALFPGGESE